MLALPLFGQALPPGSFIDIDGSNTVAVGGGAPFYTDSAADPGFTSGALWRRRAGFGFTTAGAREIFEKDANGGFGNATPLVTSVRGLVPGQVYGLYVAFLSVASESWQVKAGLTAEALTLFTPTAPVGRVTPHGLSGETGSNRTQYLGFLGNVAADASGELRVYSDDGDGTAVNFSTRSWLEGFLVGAPYTPPPAPVLPGGAVQIAPDGVWTWFNDERAIVHQGSLFSGYVLADGRYGVTRYDFADGAAYHAIISTTTSQQKDDHNNPSLTVLPSGRILAVYSKHNSHKQFYQRTSLVSRPAGTSDWGPEVVRTTLANNTYANTYRLGDEGDKLFNFHRCINFNPSLIISTDGGATWGTSVQMIGTGTGNTRPYPRYVSNHRDRIDFIYTDGHPRGSNNSIYHLTYRSGAFFKTDGSQVETLANLPLNHDGGERGSVVYPFSSAAWASGQGPDDWIPNARGWTWDIVYGRDDSPVCVFQVQLGDDSTWSTSRIFYYYARWTGTAWQRRFIAQGGRGIYAAESDYGGGMCLDPADSRIVYISTNAASPFALGDVANVPLATNARYEIWRGFTADGGLTFRWTPVTQNSAADNLRPIVPLDHGRTECLLWFFGTYTTYTNFSAQVIGRLGAPANDYAAWTAGHALATQAGAGDDPDRDGVVNLLEYALSGNPTNATLAPRFGFDGTACEFAFDPARPDVELRLQRSGDLAAWENVAFIRGAGLPVETADGYDLSLPTGAGTARLQLPSGPVAERVFFRLKADLVR